MLDKYSYIWSQEDTAFTHIEELLKQGSTLWNVAFTFCSPYRTK